MSEPAPALCAKLQPLLEHELKRGNRITARDTGWSKVALAVRLASPLDMEHLKKAAAADPDLELWQSRDVKNPRETGILCKSARQTLAGPLTSPI
jgi:hypothetical protein